MKRALLLLLLLSCVTGPRVTFDNSATFSIESAQTSEEKTKGLMGRESMPANHGMLFFFDEEKPLTFWMKDTLIPLDMIYINSDMEVVEVKANIPPCEEDPCPKYKSLPAQYVLEVNAGMAEKKKVSVGSKMVLRK